MQYYEFRAMNSAIVLAAEGAQEQVAAGFREVQKQIEAHEQRFTRFSQASELARLNRAAGSPFEASQELFEVVKLARRYHAQTRGLFDPSILPALKQAGYDRSMEKIRGEIAGSPLREPPDGGRRTGAQPMFESIWLDEATQRIQLPQGMEIDLGGIAKGWIAEQTAQVLHQFCKACAVSAGGDIVFAGRPDGQPYWEVGLEDPRQPEKTLAILKAGPGAVATSSVVKRSWKKGGKRQHHLIDPRTGQPAVTDWLSVTVMAAQAAQAEVFAKVLLIAGVAQAMDIASSQKDLFFIAVDRQGKLWGPPASLEVLDA
jgi:FAD:protein FMN transferase